MKWFRKHLKHGSRLALFALAVQFALSFGHFHALAAQAPPVTQHGLTLSDLAYIGTSVAPDTATEAVARQQPSPDTDQQPADNCAICAVMAIAGNVLFATPPLLLLPQAIELLHLTVDAEFVHLGSIHLAFQSRAPPHS